LCAHEVRNGITVAAEVHGPETHVFYHLAASTGLLDMLDGDLKAVIQVASVHVFFPLNEVLLEADLLHFVKISMGYFLAQFKHILLKYPHFFLQLYV